MAPLDEKLTPETLSLAGKVAVITGAGREPAIGSGIATTLARNGASIVLNYMSDSTGAKAESLAAKLHSAYNVHVVAIQQDISLPAGSEALVQKSLSLLKTDHIDILVNNAAFGVAGSTLDTSIEDIQKHFNVNVLGPIYLARAVVPHMPQGGRIINISSVYSKMGNSNVPFYSASKAAQDSLTYIWAKEFGRSRGITVNTVSPGPVVTDLMTKYADENPQGWKAIQDLVDVTRAADRVGEINDIADAVLLLVQEKSRWITGQYISVSGGITGG
ncbi:hypothetical protein BX600DRAFT_461304 [Xylariales sp. PMI_506]|nr:hypothetical protein BX600DRAFT_461304 [Xylariales sp. PMI_506]